MDVVDGRSPSTRPVDSKNREAKPIVELPGLYSRLPLLRTSSLMKNCKDGNQLFFNFEIDRKRKSVD